MKTFLLVPLHLGSSVPRTAPTGMRRWTTGDADTGKIGIEEKTGQHDPG